MKPPAGLVLAAGESRRMPGRSKLSRSWFDTTVVGAVVRAAHAAGLSPVTLVVREGDALPRGAGRAQRIARAPRRSGRTGSLRTGLAASPPGPVIVLLGDEPGVSPGLIEALAALCESEAADAGRIAYADRPGHPVWLGLAGRTLVAGLLGDASVWDSLAASDLRVAVLQADAPAPIDVDSPEALDRARRATEGPPAGGASDGDGGSR